jgi:hypothetical protein
LCNVFLTHLPTTTTTGIFPSFHLSICRHSGRSVHASEGSYCVTVSWPYWDVVCRPWTSPCCLTSSLITNHSSPTTAHHHPSSPTHHHPPPTTRWPTGTWCA